MEGIDVFENKPLQSDRIGTLKDPIMVPSLVSGLVPTMMSIQFKVSFS